MNSLPKIPSNVPAPRTWDARLARRLVTPLVNTWVTPNHLTTLRLLIGVAGALCLARGGFASANAGAFLIVLSNFVDHTDGELARIGGKSSRIGHFYDLACDALVTVMLFVGMGIGTTYVGALKVSPGWLGAVAGVAVALIFFLRMRIEDMAGKAGTKTGFGGRIRNRRRVVSAAHCHADERRHTVRGGGVDWRAALCCMGRGRLLARFAPHCPAGGRPCQAT